jgi:hypothetical protein
LIPLVELGRWSIENAESTNDLEMPAMRGRRDRIEPPEKAHELLAALPTSERAFWASALFCGLRRGELRGLAHTVAHPPQNVWHTPLKTRNPP